MNDEIDENTSFTVEGLTAFLKENYSQSDITLPMVKRAVAQTSVMEEDGQINLMKFIAALAMLVE